MMNCKQQSKLNSGPGPSLIAALHRRSRQKRISPTSSSADNDKRHDEADHDHGCSFEKQLQQQGLGSLLAHSSKSEETIEKNQASSSTNQNNDDSAIIKPTDSSQRRRDAKARSWNRCTSWHINSFSSASSASDEDHTYSYCTLDDSGREGDEHCLDVSDTRRLSLMDILKKDETACRNTLTPRAA